MPKRPEDPYATRRTLLNRLKNLDDQESWTEFVDSYWRLVISAALKAGLSDAEAKDAAQETFIALSKTMQNFEYDPKRSFKGFLLHTAKFKIADQLRKRRARGVSIESENESTSTSWVNRIPDPGENHLDQILSQEWSAKILEAAIERVKRRVNPKQFQIFDLYVLKSWPVRDVASAMGVSVGQIYLAKFRISRLVKKEVKSIESKKM